jgi:hypothetical protein
MAKKETYEEREARKGGENELEGSRSASRARLPLKDMDRSKGRKARKPQR